MSDTIENVEVDGKKAIAMYLKEDYTPATKDDYDLVRLLYEDGRVTVSYVEQDTKYVAKAKNPKETCEKCDYYAGDGVCMNDRVQRDPKVPEEHGLKIVESEGWCDQWKKLKNYF